MEAVVRFIGSHHPDPDAARFGVIGYRDHRGGRGEDVTQVQPCTSGEDVLRFLPSLAATPANDAYHAPLEDALALAYGRRLGWRGGATRTALVILGSRPPHPLRDSEALCPNRQSWQNQRDRFRDATVRLVAVWEPPPWCARDSRMAREARQTWASIGGRHLLDPATAGPQNIVAAAGAVPAGRHQAPLLFPIMTPA